MTVTLTGGRAATMSQTFMRAGLLVGLLLILLVLAIWMYTDNILDHEEELHSSAVPKLEVAFQLAAVTTELRAQSRLMPLAENLDELQRRRKSLDQILGQMQRALTMPGYASINDEQGLQLASDKIRTISSELYSVRSQELQLQNDLWERHTDFVEELRMLESDIEKWIAEIADRFLLESSSLSDMLVVAPDTDDEIAQRNRQMIYEVELLALQLQDLELVKQDVLALDALVQRIALIQNSDDFIEEKLKRDQLIKQLSTRVVYLGRSAAQQLLLKQIAALRQDLRGENGLLDKQFQYVELEEFQSDLQSRLTDATQDVLLKAQWIREQASQSLTESAKHTKASFSDYREFLSVFLIVALVLLAYFVYQLLYKNVVLPLVQLTDNLHSVGMSRFDDGLSEKKYKLLEIAELSSAVSDLNKAQVSMKIQDRKIKANNAELIRVNRDLEQFAHIASHDLQEPLRKVQQFSDILTEEFESVLNDEGKFCLHVINNSAQRMRVLISDTLEYSKSGLDDQAIEKINLNEEISQLRIELELLIQESNAEIEVEELPVVWANSNGMRQLIRNLITNAIKYRREDTDLRILINGRIDAELSRFFISIRDNGLGIKKEHFERVFLPFERMTSGVAHGTGLGLAICRKVCEAHGWEMTIESEWGEGSCFTISGPLSSVVGNEDAAKHWQGDSSAFGAMKLASNQ
ncbi:MAG: hypothetical protein KTR32_28875 [Granulosicoccus sp.]|nr:hypothetical protein [Granulosicoccus sp.]